MKASICLHFLRCKRRSPTLLLPSHFSWCSLQFPALLSCLFSNQVILLALQPCAAPQIAVWMRMGLAEGQVRFSWWRSGAAVHPIEGTWAGVGVLVGPWWAPHSARRHYFCSASWKRGLRLVCFSKHGETCIFHCGIMQMLINDTVQLTY